MIVVLAGLAVLGAAAGAVFLAVRPLLPAAAPVARSEVPDLAVLAPQVGRPQAAPGQAAPPDRAGPTGAPDRAGQTGAPAQAATPAQAAPAAEGPGISLTPPRLMVISRATLPERTKEDIAGLKHVEKIASFDGGAVTLSGAGLNLLAVDPAIFRAWAPKGVAGQQEVWNALLRGEVVADGEAVRRLGLVLGSHYQVDGGPRLRVAASARLGLPGVDGLVGVETGRRLGLLPGVALLVHAPRKAAGTLETGVRKLLGAGPQVVAVGTGKSDAQAPAATARPQAAGRATVGRPGSYLELYRRSAGVCPGLSWTVLAAIGQVESSHGRNNGPSSAGAQGPMQFMPATWKAYGVDGDGDGVADIWSPYDAVPSAANYLCANGAGQGGKKLEKAIWFYNHSWSYVSKVMAISEAYARTYP
ncbi:hypothetical protein Psi01_13080 [Planobispora siamensis]|uniref:Transglycosylase SLT domain-containing protein n=1 Tax=Planobispora siamensis TaxID=936338 RepID=A0A8J3WIL1_9ACTN|nr:hypothetical protein Psi01_13080 [Planobispora siamensis]